MRILLTKLNNDRHALEIIRADGSRERAELETKSLLVHDFIHLALEAEAGIQDGFWGLVAAGKTFAEMNDRTGAGIAEHVGSMAVIEMLVGALSGALSGVQHDAVLAKATAVHGRLIIAAQADRCVKPGLLVQSQFNCTSWMVLA